jgi:NAD(P)-dependent dehydrogenase (short-subunit alcohol dehydrogenase family)
VAERGGLAARVARRVVNPVAHPDPEGLRAAVGGKVVLVTGASHGIGRELAQRMAAAGARTLLVARSATVLEPLAAELGPDVRALPCDLSDPDAIAALVPALLDAHGRVDVVVSNAGHSIRRPIAESYERMHDFTRLMAVNYLGPVQLLLGLLPGMRERRSGHIVNVSSVGVVLPPAPRWAGYVASKSAFDIWLRSVAAEIARDEVTASSVYLPLVHTRMSAPTRDFDHVPGLTPGQAADLICRAVIDRPEAISPWWATAWGALASVARRPNAAYMRRYAERVPDHNGRPAQA